MSRQRGAGGLTGLLLLTALASLVPSPSAGTLVPEQALLADTAWTVAGSPYYLLGNVTVNAGVSLTIEPGVHVLVNGDYAIRVFGNLTAAGTPSAPILFASNRTTPGTGDWRGIELRATANATLSHAVLRHAFSAVRILGSPGGVDRQRDVFHNLTVERSFYGMQVAQTWNLTLRTSTFSSNSIGVQLLNTTFSSLENVQAFGNDKGISLRQNSNDNTITRSTLYLNSVAGIDINESFRNRVWANALFDNEVTQALDGGDSNLWDAGYPEGGNLWGDYSGNDTFSGPNQDLPGPDDIGDTPYVIDNNTMDRYPKFTPGPNFPPLIDLLSPANNSLFRPGTGVVLRIRDQDLNASEYAVDGGPLVAFASTAVIDTSAWSDGNHSVAVEAWDATGNRSSQVFSFRVDAILPQVTLVSPPEGLLFRPGAVLIDLEVFDANLAEVNVTLDGIFVGTLPTPYDVVTAVWLDGNHTLTIRARDTPGNLRNVSFSFRTDGTSPTVLSSDPQLGDTGVSRNSALVIDFSEPMERSSVVAALSLSLIPDIPVSYTLSWNANSTQATLIPDAPLVANRSYHLQVGTGAADRVGNTLTASFSVVFVTEPAAPEQPEEGLPFWILLTAVVLAVVVGAIAYLEHRRRVRRRRRRRRRKRTSSAARSLAGQEPAPPGTPSTEPSPGSLETRPHPMGLPPSMS